MEKLIFFLECTIMGVVFTLITKCLICIIMFTLVGSLAYVVEFLRYCLHRSKNKDVRKILVAFLKDE